MQDFTNIPVADIVTGVILVLVSLRLLPARFLKYCKETSLRIACFLGGIFFIVMGVLDLLSTVE